MGKHYVSLLAAAIVGSHVVLVGTPKPDFAAVTAPGAEPTTQPTDQDGRISVEIARLGSSNKNQCIAAVKALVKIGKPAAPALVKSLSDPRNDVRAFAAEALRPILAAEPTSAPNYHKKAYWERRVAQLKAGMTLDEALKFLLPERSPAQRRETCEGIAGGGGSSFSCYRLDDYWIVRLDFLDSGEKPLDKLRERGAELFTEVCEVGVAPPVGYTGVWVTWHVNGQKADEIQYRNGRYDGTFASFDDDGAKCVEQHYTMGVAHGTAMGWHRNGNKAYEGQCERGKQTGTWRWWNENGQIKSIQEYKAGKRVEKTDK
jgi:hypothetical protein